RFSGSTLAYQDYGRGLDVDELRRLSSWAAGGLEPDLVVLLDVAPDVAAARLDGRRDRIEAEPADFHRRVADGYRALAAADPGRWVVVDGRAPVDEVAAAIRAAVGERLGRAHDRLGHRGRPGAGRRPARGRVPRAGPRLPA